MPRGRAQQQRDRGKLVVSLGTVKFHVSNAFHKLGVNSRVKAVKAALKQKLV